MNDMLLLSDDAAVRRRDAGIQNADTIRPEIAGLMSVLLRLIDQRGPLVVYLTASSHGEGTTTIAHELSAAATRWDWCKVALIDASSLPAARGKHASAIGLLDVEAEDCELPFRQVVSDGATLMEAPLAGANTSVPRVETVRALFDRLRKEFTLIIVDSPPVLASQQMAAFSSAADCVVLVVEAERTRIVELERTRLTLEKLGARILGIVLNKRRDWVPGFLSRRI